MTMHTSPRSAYPQGFEPWFTLLDASRAVAHYIDDATSEVFALTSHAPYFGRVREDDTSLHVYLLTNDKAELIAGSATLTGLPEQVVAATIQAMLDGAA